MKNSKRMQCDYREVFHYEKLKARNIGDFNMSYYNKEKHLDYVMNAIERMARCSFMCKGWAIALAVAMLAFNARSSTKFAFAMAVIPVLLIWGRDAYYLRQEKLFRMLFDNVRTGCFVEDPYTMNVEPYIRKSVFKKEL